jgi:hypothetical protein
MGRSHLLAPRIPVAARRQWSLNVSRPLRLPASLLTRKPTGTDTTRGPSPGSTPPPSCIANPHLVPVSQRSSRLDGPFFQRSTPCPGLPAFGPSGSSGPSKQKLPPWFLSRHQRQKRCAMAPMSSGKRPPGRQKGAGITTYPQPRVPPTAAPAESSSIAAAPPLLHPGIETRRTPHGACSRANQRAMVPKALQSEGFFLPSQKPFSRLQTAGACKFCQ